MHVTLCSIQLIIAVQLAVLCIYTRVLHIYIGKCAWACALQSDACEGLKPIFIPIELATELYSQESKSRKSLTPFALIKAQAKIQSNGESDSDESVNHIDHTQH